MTRAVIQVPKWSHDVFNGTARYRVAYGGRGSGKTWEFVRRLVRRAATDQLRIMCLRELQKSIKDSVFATVKSQIEAMRMDGNFRIGKTYIESKIGSEFIFHGLRYNAEEIKSTEDVDIAYVEEAQKVSADSWKYLIPTIRKPGSEIWAVFNPDLETDPTYQRLVLETPPRIKRRMVNWDENPWFTEELDEERRYLLRVDPDAYANVWGGECRASTEAQVFHGKWSIDVFDDIVGMDGPYYGADWGFSQDPTALIRMFIHDECLFISHEAYKIGCEIDDTPKLFEKVPGSKQHYIRADNARPEMISYMNRNGYKVAPTEKWSGSVESGVKVLRGFKKIIIHERCKHMTDEARLYSHKKDRLTGDVLPDIIDKHNHGWDSVRYGLNPIIKAQMSNPNRPVGLSVAGL